jgi:hypothetical protein
VFLISYLGVFCLISVQWIVLGWTSRGSQTSALALIWDLSWRWHEAFEGPGRFRVVKDPVNGVTSSFIDQIRGDLVECYEYLMQMLLVEAASHLFVGPSELRVRFYSDRPVVAVGPVRAFRGNRFQDYQQQQGADIYFGFRAYVRKPEPDPVLDEASCAVCLD